MFGWTSRGYYGTYLSDKPQTFSYDVTSATLKFASPNNVASVPNGGTSYESALSGDGTTIAFQTAATDIVFGDTNSAADVFVVPF